MAKQELLIPFTNEEMIAKLREALKKYGRHTLYCCWVREGGYYDRTLGCTCGLAEAYVGKDE